MNKKSFLILSIEWIILLMIALCAWKPQQYYDNGVSNEEYVCMARMHHDAQVFLENYPQAEIFVDRSGSLAVDFRKTNRPVIGTTQLWEGIRLRVFIDPKTNQPTEAFIQCNNRIIKNNLRQYLEQYFTTQTCP